MKDNLLSDRYINDSMPDLEEFSLLENRQVKPTFTLHCDKFLKGGGNILKAHRRCSPNSGFDRTGTVWEKILREGQLKKC